jgi:hypothetical protein
MAMEFAEVWKDIQNTKFQISNKGRVCNSTRLMKPFVNNSGYMVINLMQNNGRRKGELIHRLVALYFCDKPVGTTEVNHKDEVKLNNYANNLEWCTRSYNVNHGNRIEKVIQKINKSVKQFDLQCNLIKIWESASAVERTIGIDQGSISKCCKGKLHSAGKFYWQFQ